MGDQVSGSSAESGRPLPADPAAAAVGIPGGTDAAVVEPAEPLPFPPVQTLIAVVGPSRVLDALRASGLDRKIFSGFRTTPRMLTNPLVLRRLQDELPHPGLLDTLARAWARSDSPLFHEINPLPGAHDDEVVADLVSRFGSDAVRWSLMLHPAPGVRAMALGIDAHTAVPLSSSQESAPDAAEGPDLADTRAKAGRDADLSRLEDRAARLEQRLLDLESKLREARKDLGELRASESARQAELSAMQSRWEAARAEVGESQRKVKEIELAADSRSRLVERLQKALDEAERSASAARKAARREAERASQAGGRADVSPGAPDSPKHRPSMARALPPTEQIVERMMRKRAYQAVAQFAREAWELDPDNQLVFGWLLDALALDGRHDESAGHHYDAAIRALGQSDRDRGIAELCLSVRAAPESPDAAWRLEKLIQSVEVSSQKEVERVAELYGYLRRESASAASEFESLARRIKRSLWRKLPSYMAREHRKVVVDLPGDQGMRSVSASDLATAVAAGDASLVEQFRRWAAAQRAQDRQGALQVIEGAEHYLPGARRVLTGITRRVLVDGSNVAWAGRSGETRADLDQVLAVRQKLFEAGYFPVVVLADASLPWQVRDPQRLDAWLLRGEITLVDSRTDADHTLWREARRLDCPVVTNDRMRDLDPEERFERIGYVIGPGGVRIDDTREDL